MTKLFDDALQALRETRQSLRDEVTMHDRAMVDYYHLIEHLHDTEIPDEELLKITKLFMKTLCRRRECKVRLNILDRIDGKFIQKPPYSPRVIPEVFKTYEEYLYLKLPKHELQVVCTEGSVYSA